MKSFVIVIACVCAVFAEPEGFITVEEYHNNAEEGRIISGTAAEIGQFPWQVGLYSYRASGRSFCGGSLIDKKWVLTAAHCALGAHLFTLNFGKTQIKNDEPGSTTLNSSIHYVHYGYNPKNLNNDIALIQLPEPVELSNKIKTIKLPKKGDKVGEGKDVTVSGWGRISDETSGVSPVLNFVSLKTISNKECAEVYQDTITDGTICCRGNPQHSTCNGDSGGPLIEKNQDDITQIGIVSFVSSKGCGSGHPSGYIRTEYFLDWINAITGIKIES